MDTTVYQLIGYGLVALIWIAASIGFIRVAAMVTVYFSSEINSFLKSIENSTLKKQNALRSSVQSAGRYNGAVLG